MSKVAIKIVADYLVIFSNILSNVFAIRSEDTFQNTLTYYYKIVPERLIAYNHGKIKSIRVV